MLHICHLINGNKLYQCISLVVMKILAKKNIFTQKYNAFLRDAFNTAWYTYILHMYILKLASRPQSKILCSILSDNKWHWFINFKPLALQFNLFISLETYIMLHEIQQDWFRYRSKNNKRAPTMSSNITVQSFQRIAGCLDTLVRIENFNVFFEWIKWMNI